jgi:NAD(P)-dependent dehydrogenase (short-subunit alcohol dehydrogenase family)
VSGRPRLSGSVVVVDETDRTLGMSAALAAAEQGCSVVLITARSGPAELVEPEVRDDFLQRLVAAGVEIRPSTQVRSYDPALGELHCGFGGLAALTYQQLDEQGHLLAAVTADQVIQADFVVHTWTEPRAELFADLPDSVDVRAVGDVLNPHRIEAAVHGAFELARTL